MVLINIIKLVSNMTYFISSYGSFPGELFYSYIGYTAINIEQIINAKEKHS